MDIDTFAILPPQPVDEILVDSAQLLPLLGIDNVDSYLNKGTVTSSSISISTLIYYNTTTLPAVDIIKEKWTNRILLVLQGEPLLPLPFGSWARGRVPEERRRRKIRKLMWIRSSMISSRGSSWQGSSNTSGSKNSRRCKIHT